MKVMVLAGQDFLSGSPPKNRDIEQVSKGDVCAALDLSTRNTQKGRYHKVRHGFAIWTQLDFEKVCDRSLRAREFRVQVLMKLGE
jgi:hypothetical protein